MNGKDLGVVYNGHSAHILMLQGIKKSFKRLVPARYRYRVVMAIREHLGGYGRTHYSQNGEDIILAALFAKKRGGFYVDVGAHHPERYSNTRLLNKKGWRGINIDPDPDAIRLFKKRRPQDINLCVGISRERGEKPFFMFDDPAVNTFSAEMAKVWQDGGNIALRETVVVKTAPLREVLAGAVPVGTQIDFLNVDAEGLDMEVLLSNDWERFRPETIAIEDHGFTAENPAESAVYRFLSEKGYTLVAVMKFSLIFTR